MGALASLGVSACSAGIASAELAKAPEWFKARQQELAGKGYPDLASAPPAAEVKKEDARWNRIEQELVAEQQAIQASPRGAPADAPAQAEDFEKAAREAIEAARPK